MNTTQRAQASALCRRYNAVFRSIARLRPVASAVAVSGLCFSIGACTGKQHDFAPPAEGDEAIGELNPASTDGGTTDTTSTQNGGGALGAACADADGCNSGFCAAGRCCESACDGLCESCSEAGLCNLVAERLTCGEAAEGIESLCNASGECVDPRALPGATCQSDRDCQAGSCVDGVCCLESCDAACETCNGDGSCVADPLGSGCGDARQCFGRGLCQQTLGSACTTDPECGSGACELAVGGGSACCATPCGNDTVCNSDGECVSPDADLGASCSSSSDCIGGRCVDGRCCDVACGAACERCNAPGQEGRCVAEPAGQQDPACSPGLECAGRNLCKSPLGTDCDLNDECRSGVCGAALQAGGEVCCEGACPSGERCAADGSCVDAPDPDGAPCINDADCINNSCVAGRCCENACDGVCEACSGLGDCNVNPGNDSRCPAVDCPQSASVCTTYPADLSTNLCAGLRTCKSTQSACQPSFAPRDTPCELVAPGVQGRCDGQGLCVDPCGTLDECDGQCVAGVCRLRDDLPCTSAGECASNQCTNRFSDTDRDGFGDEDSVGVPRCGPIPVGFAGNNRDCCDSDSVTNPNTVFAMVIALTEPDACGSFDRNCDGRVANTEQLNIDRGYRFCQEIPFDQCRGAIWIGDPNDAIARLGQRPRMWRSRQL